MTTAGAFGFGYDANGNMTSTGGMTTTWDAENCPTSIARVSGSETYAYDADGARTALRLIRAGQSNRQIGQSFGLDEKAIERLVSAICAKPGCTRGFGLAIPLAGCAGNPY